MDNRERARDDKWAAIQHDIWSHWMRWFFYNDTPENRERWKRQMVTPFAELTEGEKDSDRRVVSEFIEASLTALLDEVEAPLEASEGVLMAKLETAIRERDEARAEVQRLREEIATLNATWDTDCGCNARITERDRAIKALVEEGDKLAQLHVARGIRCDGWFEAKRKAGV